MGCGLADNLGYLQLAQAGSLARSPPPSPATMATMATAVTGPGGRGESVETRFVIEHRDSTYRTFAKVKVGDWAVVQFGESYPKTLVSKVTAIGSDYDGPVRTAIALIRGGRLL